MLPLGKGPLEQLFKPLEQLTAHTENVPTSADARDESPRRVGVLTVEGPLHRSPQVGPAAVKPAHRGRLIPALEGGKQCRAVAEVV